MKSMDEILEESGLIPGRYVELGSERLFKILLAITVWCSE